MLAMFLKRKCLTNMDVEENLSSKKPDDASLLWRDLGMLDQLRQVLLADPVLRLDVQQNDPG